MLLADKPAGVTSHDVVLTARRSLGERRIGHAGTLDPFATGLLVLLLGRATRLLPYISGEPKEYLALIRFGSETDTDDIEGTVTRTAPPPSETTVREAIPLLTGEIEQVPPAYSAKRVAGRRAYAAARAGDTVVLAPVRVRVDAWRVVAWLADAMEVAITCGGGTYVRALARDLGRLAGSAAHLAALRRTRSGPFRATDAASLDEIRAGTARVLPPLRALDGTPIQRLDDDELMRIVRGVDVTARVPGERAALVQGETDTLVALAERRGDRWQPRVVMRRA